MFAAAENLEFEEAARLRDEINKLEDANAAIQAIDASDPILNREGSDPIQEKKKQRSNQLIRYGYVAAARF